MKKIFYIVQSFLFAYLIAFFVLINPFAVNMAQAGGVANLPTNSFEMNANPALIYSVTQGLTKLSKNVSANYRTTTTYTDTAPMIVANYVPLAQQGQIALLWIHRFPDQKTYDNWVQTATKAGQYGNPANGYLWYSVPVQNSNAIGCQAVIYHLLTPQELFKLDAYAMPSGNSQASNYGKVFGASYNYNSVTYCSANNTGGYPCSDLAYKIGSNGFQQIIAEVAREYHTTTGVYVVDNQTTHTETEKSSSAFRTTVTVKVYLDTTPAYYLIMPNWTPGITQMGNSGWITQASSTDGGIGFVQVQQNNPGTWGWNWNGASQLIYEKSESGWNTAVAIGLGVLVFGVGSLMGNPVIGFLLQSGGLTYAGLSTAELAIGQQQFYGVNYYNLGNEAGANEVTHNAILYSCAWWADRAMGAQYPSGIQQTLSMWSSGQPLQNAGMTVGAFQPSANEKQILQDGASQ